MTLVAAYLAATGWTARALAKRAGVHESTISRIVHGDPAGELAASKIARATRRAHRRGETSVTPLRESDLRSRAVHLSHPPPS